MIYEKIKNLQEIVGEEAHSLSWPIGGIGAIRRDYFFSKDFIRGHFDCQPFSEGDPYIMEGIASDCFLTRRERPIKDEAETLNLYSYQLPQYYGKPISEVIEFPSLGFDPVKNSFSDNRHFVILWEDMGKIIATVPKEMGHIPWAYEKNGITVPTQGNTLWRFLNDCFPDLKLEENTSTKPIGLWYTNSALEKTPTINIEDAWDTAMMTYYHPKRTETTNDGMFIKEYSPEEIITSTEEIIKNELIGTSRKFADIADGTFLAAYNLHDYLQNINGKLEPAGHDSQVPKSFGGARKFLDALVEWVSEQFPHVEVCSENDVPIILASDRKINI